MMHRFVAGTLASLIVFLSLHCSGPAKTPVVYPIQDDGGPAKDPCEASCRNQRRLSCPGASGRSAPSGKTCEDVCREQDPLYDLHALCVAAAQDCKAVLACFGQ